LTTATIDKEVRLAKKFRPNLTEFAIATTAPNDARLQDHALAITARHQSKGLFAVYVFGWDEITRRLTQYPELVNKHFGFITLSGLQAEIPDRTAELVIERLASVGVVQMNSTGAAAPLAPPIDELQPRLIEAAERDLANRFGMALKRSLFPEASKSDAFQALAEELQHGEVPRVSQSLHRSIFLRAARSAALRGKLEKSEQFISAAQALPGKDSDLPARARLAEAKGQVENAIQLLRDETDSECRSTLLSILSKNRGGEAAIEWLADLDLSIPDLAGNGVHAAKKRRKS